MKVLHFNRDELYLGRLQGILEMRHTEEINGENFLELITVEAVNKKDRLIYQDQEDIWHEFIVSNVEEAREGAVLVRRIYAEHSIYETLGDYIVDSFVDDKDATVALTAALATTRWSVGAVSVTGNETAHFYNINSRNALQMIIDIWGGEIQYRIEVTDDKISARYVDLLEQRGEVLDRRFTYNKALENIKRTINDDDVITALYGFGKGNTIKEGGKEYVKRLDFASINGGKAYVEDNTAKNQWGRVDQGEKVHVFSKVEYDDIENKEELLELTQKRLAELSQPNITYEASIIDFARFEKDQNPVSLGDTITIIDRDFSPELRLTARANKLVQDLIFKDQTYVVLGNFLPTLSNVLIDQGRDIYSLRNREGSGGGFVDLAPYLLREDKVQEAYIYNNVAAYYNSGASVTGAIVITLGHENVMLEGEISLRSYYIHAKVFFGGYTHVSTNNWHLPQAKGLVSGSLTVRFATNTETGRRVIILGEHNTEWQYPIATISRITTGFGGKINPYTWTISLDTNLDKYDIASTITI